MASRRVSPACYNLKKMEQKPQAPSAETPPQSKSLPKQPTDIAHVLLPDEKLLFVLRRHIIGIIYIYLQVLGSVLAILAIGFFAAPTIFDSLSDNAFRVILALGVMAIALMVFILLIATYVYRLSMLIVTDISLVQVVQSGLFVRKVSRFTMSDVEDVTAEQKGIMATLFNYGTLTVQTAGTTDNFLFTYCPNPNKYAHDILVASQGQPDEI